METIGTLYALFLEKLAEPLTKREAQNITRIVFEDVMDVAPADLHDKKQDEVGTEQANVLGDILHRLLSNEPLQYVLGNAHFHGLQFKVDHSVLIPRPETEELVSWVLEDHKDGAQTMKILDVGTGSGCIAITLKFNLPKTTVEALDISEAALKVAAFNATTHETDISFHKTDFLDSVLWPKLGQFDIIISNPPYVSLSEQEDMEDNVLDYEPTEALFVPDEDRHIFYRNLIAFAEKHLIAGGKLYAETSEYDNEELHKMLEDSNLSNVTIRKDMSGKERMFRAGR